MTLLEAFVYSPVVIVMVIICLTILVDIGLWLKHKMGKSKHEETMDDDHGI